MPKRTAPGTSATRERRLALPPVLALLVGAFSLFSVAPAAPQTPRVSLWVLPNPVPEGGVLIIDLALSSPLADAVSIPVTLTAGTAEPGDYGTSLTRVNFPAGSTESFRTIDINRDADTDDETFTVALGTLPSSVTAGTPNSVTVRITGGAPPVDHRTPPGVLRPGDGDPPGDDDEDGEPPPPSVSVSPAEALESAGAVVFDVRLSRSSDSEATVDYATEDGAGDAGARAGSDYTETSGTLTFAPGAREEQVRVPVTDDRRYEATETFTLTLRRPENATFPDGDAVLRATGTILDDDDGPPEAAFEAVGADCGDELCRAATGEAVRFVDTSAGRVLSRLWDFGDGTTSRSPRVEHSWSSPGFHDVTLTVGDGETGSSASRTFLVEAAEPAGACVADAETLCLRDSRYAVTVEWRTAGGESGAARVVHAGTNDSGLFRFFDEDNWEILVKVLDGCAVNGAVWVFAAATTDLGFSIEVADTKTGTTRVYANEPGRPAAAITDARAFADACAP